MRKTYNLVFLINLIVGFLLFYNFLFVYETVDKYNLLILIIAFVFYLIADILYFRVDRLIDRIDIINTIIYIVTILLIFAFSVYYQMIMPDVFSMVYFNTLLIIPHVLYIVYNVLRNYK
jgi:hypothetical protein